MASGGAFTPASATLETYDNNLILACSLDEAQGVSRANPVTGGVTPFDEVNGPIPSVAGKKNNDADFEFSSTQHLKASGAAAVVGGLAQVTAAAWVKWESAITAVILEEDKSAGGGRYSLAILSTGAVTNGMDDGAGFKSKTTAAGKVSTGVFTFIAAIINTTNNWISIWVNGVKEVNQSALTMGTIDNSATINGFNIGGLNAANTFDGLIGEVVIWNTILSDAAIDELHNSDVGRFWRADVTPPAVPDKVIKYRLKDSAAQFVTMVSARKGTESDLSHVELARADLDTATVPTHMLEDDTDGTTSWPTLAASTTPYKLGSTEDAASLPLEADRYVGWGDPDQTGADDNRAYFMRTVDTFGNQSAWVKAADGTAAGGTAPGKATGVSAVGGQDRINISYTTPADPAGGTTDRVAIAIATSAAQAATNANAGTFALIFDGLAASTAYTNRIVAELSGGTDISNGTTYYLIAVPGSSGGAFGTSAVAGDAVSATPALPTPDGQPVISGTTPASGQVTLTIAAADEADVIYARYRNTTGGNWAAESETFKRTGSGTIVVTGLTDDTHYEFQVYGKQAANSVTSDWSAPAFATPTAGSNDPSGIISLPLDNLANTIAGSGTFQAWVGAAGQAAAKDSVHPVVIPLARGLAALSGGTLASIAVTEAGKGYRSAPTVTIEGDGTGAAATAQVAGGVVTGFTITSAGSGYTWANVYVAGPELPFAVVGWMPDFTRTAEVRGSRNFYEQTGTLFIIFRAAVNAAHDDKTAAYAFLNKIGAIMAEMEQLAGTATYLDVSQWDFEDTPRRPEEDERTQYRDFYEQLIRVTYQVAI